ncbi:family 43 glycosylhydrolase [Fulvivirga sp. M361]|uniref:glycoside hydrolase family 43 protein n=1 Tax=Fulvivirga sp. M361 TaxID=2594266 RepID=UPI0016283C71|nr:glycoside hydrolase family 43 protein [Fulvivirga sp. M361]
MSKMLFLPSIGSLLLLFWTCATNQTPESQLPDQPDVESDSLFLNPIHTHGPDPWVFQTEGQYFLTFTTGVNVTLYRSSEMSNLSGAFKKVIWTPPSTGPNSQNIWAPEIHRVHGKWYVYYAADDGNNENHRMFVLENSHEDPMAGQWVDSGELKLPDNRWAIDGTIFEHEDQLYYLWSGWEGVTNIRQNIYICKMSDPLTPTGKRVLLTSPELSWETNGVIPTVTEGPQMLKKDDRLFIVYSAGGCWTDGYTLGMLSARKDADLMDPASWEKSPQPVFIQNPEGNAFGPGHNGFFTSKDGTEDWIIYHANGFAGQGCGNKRSARIQPFLWKDDGTPDFGQPHPLYQKLTKPSGEY